MNITRRSSIFALIGGAIGLSQRKAAADGVQVIGNHGQIVSTGPVNVRQAAGGYQYMDSNGNWVAIQGVSNDLQVVSTDAVNVDQSAAGQQAIQQSGGGGYNDQVCSPGEYYEEGGCLIFCAEDGCSWNQYCCQACPKPKKGCCH
jgi:hypothetical protein